MDIPRASAHFVETYRLETVFGHRPSDHRVEADVGQLLAVVDPRLSPAVGLDDFRRPVRELVGQAAGEGVRGFDDVVVHRDHRVAARGPGRIGQKGDRALCAGLRRGEVQVGGQLVDRFHSSISLRGSAVSVTQRLSVCGGGNVCRCVAAVGAHPGMRFT
jgi:hypothetical protein